uniref:Uncharacterized protein n=1 Tax=viral metagenome TaxID=1070528 RepID=A0A2V0RJ33_9ZZZZ
MWVTHLTQGVFMNKETTNTDVKQSWPTYSEYLRYCTEIGINSKLSKQEWNDFEKEIASKTEDKHYHGLGFMPGPAFRPSPRLSPISPIKPGNSIPTNSPIKTGPPTPQGPSGMSGPSGLVSDLFDLYSTLSDPTVPPGDKAGRVATTIIGLLDASAEARGGNVKVQKDENERNLAQSYQLKYAAFSIKPPAIEVSYSPDIPNTVFSDYYRTVNDKDANVYLSSNVFRIPQDDPDIENYINNILIPDLQTRANVNVNFNVNAEQVFTPAKVTSYMSQVMVAMQTYYSLANILAYPALEGNSNTGMYRLRSMISADDINALNLLGERLNNIPIPPRLRELAFWLSGIYKSTNQCPNSPVLMITPLTFENFNQYPWDNNGNGYFSQIKSSIQFLINALNPDATVSGSWDGRFVNMLAKVCPGWLGAEMGSSSGIPLHDPHWMDVWSNSSSSVTTADSTGAQKAVPVLSIAQDRGETIRYVTHCTEISGINQALFSTSLGNNNWSGLLMPAESTVPNQGSDGTPYYGSTNRLVFSSGSGVGEGAFYPYYGSASTQSNFQDDGYGFNYPVSQSGWYNNPGAGLANNFYMPVDCQPVRGMNLSSNLDPSYMSTRWLMSFDEALTGISRTPRTSKRRSNKKSSSDLDKMD